MRPRQRVSSRSTLPRRPSTRGQHRLRRSRHGLAPPRVTWAARAGLDREPAASTNTGSATCRRAPASSAARASPCPTTTRALRAPPPTAADTCPPQSQTSTRSRRPARATASAPSGGQRVSGASRTAMWPVATGLHHLVRPARDVVATRTARRLRGTEPNSMPVTPSLGLHRSSSERVAQREPARLREHRGDRGSRRSARRQPGLAACTCGPRGTAGIYVPRAGNNRTCRWSCSSGDRPARVPDLRRQALTLQHVTCRSNLVCSDPDGDPLTFSKVGDLPPMAGSAVSRATRSRTARSDPPARTRSRTGRKPRGSTPTSRLCRSTSAHRRPSAVAVVAVRWRPVTPPPALIPRP